MKVLIFYMQHKKNKVYVVLLLINLTIVNDYNNHRATVFIKHVYSIAFFLQTNETQKLSVCFLSGHIKDLRTDYYR